MSTVYTCPDCGGDLTDEGFNLWCPACQQSISFAQAIGDTDDDPEH